MVKKGKKERFDKRLKVYSAAAAGILALAPSAEAAIHYSGVQNLPVNPSHSQNIDLNGDATNDFIFDYSKWTSNASSWGKGPYLEGTHGAAHIAGLPPHYCSDAIKLASNYQIKGTLANNNHIWRVDYWDSLNGTFTGKTNNCQGNFNNATGYIGVRFHTNACGDGWNYGWIHYRGDSITSGTIIDWAYEDQCNIPILAGAKGTTPPVTPTAVIPTLDQWGMIVLTLLLGGLAARMLGKRGKEES